MPLLLILFLLILLPAMEVYLLFSWIGESPLPALLYLSASIVAGFLCLQLAKAGLRDLLPRLRSLREGDNARVFLLIGKLWLIGVLLLFPGYLTDIAALCLLLFVRGAPPSDSAAVEVRGRLLDDD